MHKRLPPAVRRLVTVVNQRKCSTASNTAPDEVSDQNNCLSLSRPSQIAHFDKLSHEWWNVDGPMKALHAMNEVRVPWIAQHAVAYSNGAFDGALRERELQPRDFTF